MQENIQRLASDQFFTILSFFIQEEEERVEDLEMDDELDYGNNYFDNGEGYNDEDDNLDEGDGPVYQRMYLTQTYRIKNCKIDASQHD